MSSRTARRLVAGFMLLAIVASTCLCSFTLDSVSADEMPPLLIEYHLPYIAK